MTDRSDPNPTNPKSRIPGSVTIATPEDAEKSEKTGADERDRAGLRCG
jgi:hypothetical protein